ncbi:TetR/AcrR family transcriptional regulator [Kocuria rosea]|uniref:TetR/AcrR family transcriptional regulator n=1 Tax=Kocuria rosea TaxID=1275 RepID=UPI00203D8F7E|nr:TetR/AcrR family transcriptional regulator [Kocuria rosea]
MPSRQETTGRKRARTLAIERNAVALVQEHGLEQVTVDMICSKSEISQRTFFNYYKTKDEALIGPQTPGIHEGRAREFLVSHGTNLLAEALELVADSLATSNPETDQALMAARMQIALRYPQIFRKVMEAMNSTQEELAELIFLRLRRNHGTSTPPEDLREQAGLMAHLVFGALRFTMTTWMHDPTATPRPPVEHTTGLLNKVMAAPTGHTRAADPEEPPPDPKPSEPGAR